MELIAECKAYYDPTDDVSGLLRPAEQTKHARRARRDARRKRWQERRAAAAAQAAATAVGAAPQAGASAVSAQWPGLHVRWSMRSWEARAR